MTAHIDDGYCFRASIYFVDKQQIALDMTLKTISTFSLQRMIIAFAG